MPVKKRLVLVVAVTLLVLIPAIVMVLVTWVATGTPQGAATWASIPAVVSIFAAVSGGRRYAVIVSIVMGFLAPVAIVAGLSPVSGAALMAILCMVVGRMSRVGLHKSALLVPVLLAWALIDPPVWDKATSVDRLDTAYLLWMALIFFIGALIPALLVPYLLRKRPRPQPVPHSRHDAVVYTVMITILVTVATYYVLANPKLIGGAFLVAVLLVMAPIGTTATIKPTIFRIIGTVAGSILVILLVSQVHSLGLIYVIGLIVIMIAVYARLSGLAWLYYVFMVPATACLNATSVAQVGELGKQRVGDNVVGGILIILATIIAIAYANWSSRHGHATNSDTELNEAMPSLT